MKAAKEILAMIEAVEPGDAAKLDEIDALVFCYANGHTFRSMLKKARPHDLGYFSFYDKGKWKTRVVYPVIQYTRSRDALKKIRPEGWQFTCCQRHEHEDNSHLDHYAFWLCMDDANHYVIGKHANEELAELHAIIQAIAHERGEP